MVINTPLQKHLQPRFGDYHNIKHLEEPISTDPIFANCRSIYNGYTGVQAFFGVKSHMMNVEGFRRKGEFPNNYRDFIRQEGAPSILRRDNAKEENSDLVLDIQRELYIKDEFSEPYYPNQNPVESRMIRYLKQSSHTLMDITGAPPVAWYYAITYICEVHNRTADLKLPNSITPYQMRHGSTPDISAYLQFTFWEPILFLDTEETWPATRE